MPRPLAFALLLVATGAGAAACASAPTASTGTCAEAAALGVARAHVLALRAAHARAYARVDAIRDVVRARDPLAPWRELVCLEAGLPRIVGFTARGERAYDALRAAVERGDADRAALRLASLDLARRGIERQLALAHACESPLGDTRALASGEPSRLVSLAGSLPTPSAARAPP